MLNALLFLFSCQAEPGSPGGDTVANTPDDTASAPTPPSVWGVAAAEDFDPDPDVVEVHLSAGLATADWVEDNPTEVWAYNGQVPGPLIQVLEGQTLRVILDNNLESADTTIHWHGLRIDDAMDGVPAMQDPVAPGERFTYTFAPPDTGTFWYHPHVAANEEIERGLQGPLIVHEADAPAVDRDRYFVLDDVYLRSNGRFYGFNMDHMTSMHGRYGNLLLANGSAELLTDAVRPQGVERWRVLNTANARPMWVSVSGAAWRVIGVDANLLPEPYTVTRAALPPGRRLDLEVIPDADAATVNLNIELPGGFMAWDVYPMFEGTVTGEPGDGQPLDWPAADLPAIEAAQQAVDLALDASFDEDGDLIWTVNGVVFGEGEPIQVAGATPTTITLREKSGLDHPFHLHGQFFQVLSRDGAQEPEDAGLMDTVMVGARETVELYTGFENPGRWMAHCHILEHAELGMMTEIDVSE